MQPKVITRQSAAVIELNAIKANDEKALKALYHANYAKVESYVITNNGNTDQAKDIYQEAFIAMWRNIQLDKFQPENETALAGYLYSIAKNKWLDYLRSAHYKTMQPIGDLTDVSQPEDLPKEEHNYIVSVKDNFKRLGSKCQQVLAAFYYKKEPLKNIAEKLGWTVATAKNNKYRCLQQLKQLMKAK